MRAFFFCRRVVPSPSLLQSVARSEVSVGEQFIILPPFFVGVNLTFGRPIWPIYVDHPHYANITFVDVIVEGMCITSAFICPNWSDLKMFDLVSLLTLDSGVSGGGTNSPWAGNVSFTPGRIVTQANSSAPYAVHNMGASHAYDFCLGG